MFSSETELNTILTALAAAVVDISDRIHTVELKAQGSVNASGEEQIPLDLVSNKIVQDHLAETGLVAVVASEELDEVVPLEGEGYAVVYDPLDGSSLVDVNLAVGTIFGIYEGHELIGRTGREMVAAGFAVYGPRTTLVLSTGQGVHEYHLSQGKEWFPGEKGLTVGPGKMFAPGNLRAVAHREDYRRLVEWWMAQEYKLRYSGGMVPDVNQILLKGKGIFSYPGYEPGQPDGKLRLVFEAAPMSYLMEQAGGAGSDGTQPILDKRIDAIHQRTPVYVGSKEEVARCEEYLG